jgi:hypothetical protein
MVLCAEKEIAGRVRHGRSEEAMSGGVRQVDAVFWKTLIPNPFPLV